MWSITLGGWAGTEQGAAVDVELDRLSLQGWSLQGWLLRG